MRFDTEKQHLRIVLGVSPFERSKSVIAFAQARVYTQTLERC